MFKSAIGILSALVLISMTLGAANAQNLNAQNLVVDALKGCSKEIETYCSSVTPGGGRLVSCARAHEDKLLVGNLGAHPILCCFSVCGGRTEILPKRRIGRATCPELLR